MAIRALTAGDRPGMDVLLRRVKEFDAADVQVAVELLESSLAQPGKDYTFLVDVAKNGQVIGFVCYGSTPLTDGTYDLYWIAVDPDFAGQGVGLRLVAEMERLIRAAAGRMVVIETSSSPLYAAARAFYLKTGYHLAETIGDFYRPGEDRLTFVKVFH
jgi:ribosomal protein S18 acetylase RimI-like enzyme